MVVSLFHHMDKARIVCVHEYKRGYHCFYIHSAKHSTAAVEDDDVANRYLDSLFERER